VKVYNFEVGDYHTYFVSAVGVLVHNSCAEGPACFIAGTPISTENGPVSIEKIRVGDLVYSENPATGVIGLKRVLQTYVHETSELVHIKVNGQSITCSDTHPFYVPKKGWTEAIELRAGDQLLLQSGKVVIIEVVQHEILEKPVKVYNFEVEDFHTYFVSFSQILVHNSCAPRGMNNPSTKAAVDAGNNAHKAMDYGAGVEKEVRISSTARVDGLDTVNRTIYELKPNNARAIARGISQLNRYESILGGNWTKILKLY
jgi:hypothetical protein